MGRVVLFAAVKSSHSVNGAMLNCRRSRLFPYNSGMDYLHFLRRRKPASALS